MDGRKLHVDSSLVDANASNDSIVEGLVALITALKQACGAVVTKLDEVTTTPESYQAVGNDQRTVGAPRSLVDGDRAVRVEVDVELVLGRRGMGHAREHQLGQEPPHARAAACCWVELRPEGRTDPDPPKKSNRRIHGRSSRVETNAYRLAGCRYTSQDAQSGLARKGNGAKRKAIRPRP